MQDNKYKSKTKEQLLNEIARLQERITELEKSGDERKRIDGETESRTAELERYRAIFEDAAVGIVQSSPEGRLLSANKAFAHMYGYEVLSR